MTALRNQFGLCARLRWMLGAAALVGIAGFYLLGWRPMSGRLHTLYSHIQQQRQELDRNQSRAKELPNVALKVEGLQSRLDRHGKKMPKQLDLGPFMGELTQISQQAALRGFTWTPGPSKRMDLFVEQPICLNFEGDFIQSAMFLRQIEDLQRLTRVRRLNVRSRDDKTGAVEVEVTLNIYFAEGL